MFKIYRSGNYIIAEKSGKTYEYGIGKTVYTYDNDPTAPKYSVIETNVGDKAAGNLPILVSEINAGNWENDGAIVYTEATLVTFLRENSGFNLPASATGLPTVLIADNTTDGSPIKFTGEDKLQGLATANYINFNDSENDGIFQNLISGNGFVRLFEAVTWLMNTTIVRLQAPSIQLITEVFRLRDTSSNFEAQINMNKLTANRVQEVPDASGVYALESAITQTLNFGGGSTGDVATITVTKGIITAITLVP